jgi:hypothetical protein
LPIQRINSQVKRQQIKISSLIQSARRKELKRRFQA